MRLSGKIGFGLAASILMLAPNLRAQAEAAFARTALRADVKMILVPVTVTDRRGAVVNGLGQDSFTVLDEKVPQKIVSFSSEDAPCSVGLVLDLSGSMKNAIKPAKEALVEFLGTANPLDEFILFGISSKPLIYPAGSEALTSDPEVIQDSIQHARPGGSTALVDTIYMALEKMRSARNPRRALLIVSDGMDNHSRHSKQELIRIAVEADVQMYTIAIDAVPHEKKGIQQLEARRGLNYLDDLADRTGGVHVVTQNRQEVNAAAERIGRAIRNQYIIGYRPQNQDATGKWHRVQVKLDRDQVQVYARTGYYAR